MFNGKIFALHLPRCRLLLFLLNLDLGFHIGLRLDPGVGPGSRLGLDIPDTFRLDRRRHHRRCLSSSLSQLFLPLFLSRSAPLRFHAETLE